MQRVIFTPGTQILQSEEEAKRRREKVTSVRSLLYEAEECVRLGKYDKAIECYEAAQKREKSLLPLVTGKAQALIKAGRLEEAVKSYSKALKMSPNNATVLFNRGVVYQKMRKYEEAVKDYVRSAEILPRNIQVHYNCALALKRLGFFEDALKEIDKALKIDPKNVDALFNKANILIKMKEFKLALESLEEAGTISPEDQQIKEKVKLVAAEYKAWEESEPERRKTREQRYGTKSQLHGYYNRAAKQGSNSSLNTDSTNIRVCKLTPEDTKKPSK
mmetsp:Transcript_16260/g.40048  ORF Transcript_16260/g.40048 Transcript_16260/m.40048 type:complete len:275 (-) Transcript_16260:112-936(-)